VDAPSAPPSKGRLLVVDDQRNMRATTALLLRAEGFTVDEAGGGEEALGLLAQRSYDLLLTDLKMEPMDGLTLLKRALDSATGLQVIVMTAYGSIETAVEAIRSGAYDYITKPFKDGELVYRVQKALERARLLRTVDTFAGEFKQRHGLSALVGTSAAMRDLTTRISRVATSDATVLVIGESGTGKELVATALHDGSSRKDKPLIKINCAAIPKDLMESELFGYERGAFTGAVTSKPGRFELADAGTLFLDEIGEVPIEMQVKLLRVLQESEFERVGGIKTTRVDVRVIAATNRDLLAEVEAGRFRKDLYYRLNVVPIHLPPLRDRRADVPALVRHFIEKYNKRLNKKIEGIADEALVTLQAYPWPGNIRELENLMERVILFADGPRIEAHDLPAPVRSGVGGTSLPTPESLTHEIGETPLKEILKARQAEIEKAFIVQALGKTEGNVTRAAKLLGISRKSLQTKMKEFGLRDESPTEE
jgi:DNA-binding NtrC family response regulator